MRRIAVALSIALFAVGCGTDNTKVTSADVTEPSPKASSPSVTTASWPTDVAIHRNAAGQVECPVMKGEIKSPEDKKFQDYNGKRYYFCCDGCPETFKKDPKQYADNNDEKTKPTDG